MADVCWLNSLILLVYIHRVVLDMHITHIYVSHCEELCRRKVTVINDNLNFMLTHPLSLNTSKF